MIVITIQLIQHHSFKQDTNVSKYKQFVKYAIVFLYVK